MLNESKRSSREQQACAVEVVAVIQQAFLEEGDLMNFLNVVADVFHDSLSVAVRQIFEQLERDLPPAVVRTFSGAGPCIRTALLSLK